MRRRETLEIAAAAMAGGGKAQALANEQVVIERPNPQQPHGGKVLALITPHLDDGPIFAGGTLAKLMSEGYTTHSDQQRRKNYYHSPSGKLCLPMSAIQRDWSRPSASRRRTTWVIAIIVSTTLSRTELRGRLIFPFACSKWTQYSVTIRGVTTKKTLIITSGRASRGSGVLDVERSAGFSRAVRRRFKTALRF